MFGQNASKIGCREKKQKRVDYQVIRLRIEDCIVV